MHILITNDDGITAPGLFALAQAARPFGECTVLAPDHNWSASGHVKTMHRPLRVHQTQLPDGSPALSSDGAPSDCVALAVLDLLPRKIDLVVSGINPGLNVGHDLTYSGTVTAAMEAAISGLPAIAVSLETLEDRPGPLDFSAAAWAASQVIEAVRTHGLPNGMLLNVNVPARPQSEIQGFRVTRQGLRIYRDELVRREDPRGRPYYWIGGAPPTGVPEDGSDFGALAAGYVSITPVQLDLTAHAMIPEIQSWGWK